jgi:hypothetical protein
MHMTSYVGIKPDKYDQYATPPDVWNLVAHLLPRDSVVWEAAYLEGSPGPEGLHKLGLDVIYDELDFFTQVPSRPFDYIVTNPPFSDKMGWLDRAIALGKPFIFLMPSSAMGAQGWIKRFADDPLMQVLLPRRRLSFIPFRNGKMAPGNEWTKSPFDTAFYCYKFFLPNKIDFCKDMVLETAQSFKRIRTRLEQCEAEKKKKKIKAS